MNLEQYQPLAMRTAKPLDVPYALMHGAMGIGSEAGELAATAAWRLDANQIDTENLVEELGDCVWFAAYIAQTIGVTLHTLLKANPCLSVKYTTVDEAVLGFAIYTLQLNARASEVTTQIKAHTIYNKVLDATELERNLVNFMHAVHGVCDSMNLHFGAVLAANIAKLAKRYGDKYSDLAAVERADKVEEKVYGAFDTLPTQSYRQERVPVVFAGNLTDTTLDNVTDLEFSATASTCTPDTANYSSPTSDSSSSSSCDAGSSYTSQD